MSDPAAQARVNGHAKLLSYREQQALVFLQRCDNDALSIIVQLWVGATDEQLRIAIGVEGSVDDNQAIYDAFTYMNSDSLALTLDGLGVPELLAAA